MGRMHFLYSRKHYDPVHWMYPRSVFKAAFSLVKVSWIWLPTKNGRSMKTVFSWGTFDAFNELLYSHHRWVTLFQNDLRWPLTSVLTFRILDKIESVDNIKRRKSTNIPEKTIGGLSQWFPLAFLLMVAYARSSLIRLSSFISRQSRHGYEIRFRWKVFSLNGKQAKTYFPAQKLCLKFCQINPIFDIFFISAQF